MLANVDRSTMIVASVLSTTIVGGISGEHVQTIALSASAVGAIVAALAWLDKRIERKISAHAKEEEKLASARDEAMLSRIKLMLAEHRAEEAERRANNGGHAD